MQQAIILKSTNYLSLNIVKTSFRKKKMIEINIYQKFVE